nr:UDP-N-acetylmuramate dehydrogenase [Acidimicrobiia bacterium]
RCAAAGRGGLEFMVGIPGSVGGGVRMNAGGHGSDTAAWLVSARVIDVRRGAVAERPAAALGLSYRHSDLGDGELVVAATFQTLARPRREGEAIMREIVRWRRQNQPGGTLNAGSVFKNPPGDAAGRLIDQAGLKGLRVGGVAVSEKHANFFVAEAGASAQDLYDLVSEVRRRVRERAGVDLEPEVRFVGEFEERS